MNSEENLETLDVPTKEIVQEKPKAKKTKPKVSYQVILTCPKYTVVVGKDGNNIRLSGNYNTKIGDYIEI